VKIIFYIFSRHKRAMRHKQNVSRTQGHTQDCII